MRPDTAAVKIEMEIMLAAIGYNKRITTETYLRLAPFISNWMVFLETNLIREHHITVRQVNGIVFFHPNPTLNNHFLHEDVDFFLSFHVAFQKNYCQN